MQYWDDNTLTSVETWQIKTEIAYNYIASYI